MSYLALVRHGKSEWNKLGLWTGWTDIPLAEDGIEEAKKAGILLKDVKFDKAFTSKLIRAKQTLSEIQKEINLKSPIATENEALNERDYGDFTGKNKWDVKKQVGEEEFKKIRRAWDYKLPNGESLEDVYKRAVPYFKKEIVPKITKGENIIIAAHGNSLRALVKYLESIPDSKISKLEIGTGEVYLYKIDGHGKVLSKEIRSVNPDTGKI